MEVARIRNLPEIDFQTDQRVHHFANIAIKRAFDGIDGAPVISRAQRFRQSRGTGWNNSVRGSRLGTLKNTGEKRGRNVGHIAGYDEIPFRIRGGKSGVNPGKSATGWIDISNYGITKVTIPGGIGDQSHVASSLMYLRRHVLNQRRPFEWKQRFIGTHAGTPATRQHESRAFHPEDDNIIRMHYGLSYVAEK